MENADRKKSEGFVSLSLFFLFSLEMDVWRGFFLVIFEYETWFLVCYDLENATICRSLVSWSTFFFFFDLHPWRKFSFTKLMDDLIYLSIRGGYNSYSSKMRSLNPPGPYAFPHDQTFLLIRADGVANVTSEWPEDGIRFVKSITQPLFDSQPLPRSYPNYRDSDYSEAEWSSRVCVSFFFFTLSLENIRTHVFFFFFFGFWCLSIMQMRIQSWNRSRLTLIPQEWCHLILKASFLHQVESNVFETWFFFFYHHPGYEKGSFEINFLLPSESLRSVTVVKKLKKKTLDHHRFSIM